MFFKVTPPLSFPIFLCLHAVKDDKKSKRMKRNFYIGSKVDRLRSKSLFYAFVLKGKTGCRHEKTGTIFSAFA